MKLSDGFQKPLPSVGIVVFYCASIFSLTMAVKTIEISVAYAIWSAVGIAVIAMIGVMFFGEQFSFWKIFFLIMIVFGVIGLNLSSR